jgi:indole-3-glycerol phosphate synthase
MVTILDEIVQTKYREIEQAKLHRSLWDLQQNTESLPPTRNFQASLRQPGLRIIAEVKKASPSAGIIRADFEPVKIAKIYEANGADCLSVLTDESYFQGHLDFLKRIHPEVQIPVLRKEFILDAYQLFEARLAGADAVLLIAEILPDESMKKLYDQAIQLGLHVLIELHDAEQLSRVVDTGCALIGINNRDLRSFETRLEHTLDLIPKIPTDRVIVSESGIKTHADCQRLEAGGAKAILVGESLMRSADIGMALRGLRGLS